MSLFINNYDIRHDVQLKFMAVTGN